MQQVLEPRFSCGACGKTFKWKPEIAGKKGKCACGASIMVPMTAPQLAGAKQQVTVTTTPVVKRAVPVTAVAKKPAGQSGACAPVVAVPVLKSPILKPAIPTPPPPVAPPPPPQEEEDQGEYDMADGMSNLDSLLPTPEAIAAAELEAPPPLPAEPVAAEPIEYQRPTKQPKPKRQNNWIDPETGDFPDPMRNYVVPAILLAAGLLGIVLHVIWKMGVGSAAELAIPLLMAILLGFTAVKTFILVMLAFPLATRSGVYMGLLRTAIFKLAATIFFGDIAILWLIAGLRSQGIIGPRGEGGLSLWLVYAVVLALIFYACFIYLFRISVADFRFAYRMSLASRICNLVLNLAFIAFVGAIVASRSKANAPVIFPGIQPPPAQNPMSTIPVSQSPILIAPGTPMTAQPGQNSPTMMDAVISQQIHLNRMTEGYSWCRSGRADDADKKLISDMYNSGADKVYVGGIATMYAQLPTDPVKRQTCLDVAHAFRKKYGLPDDPSVNSLNYQYIVIDLMGSHK